jgi:hypothetical protein
LPQQTQKPLGNAIFNPIKRFQEDVDLIQEPGMGNIGETMMKKMNPSGMEQYEISVKTEQDSF